MGYFDMTIEDLDRAIDRVETIAKSLAGSDHNAPDVAYGYATVRRLRFKGGRLYHRIKESRQPEDGRYLVGATLCGASGNEIANVVHHLPGTRPICEQCERRAESDA